MKNSLMFLLLISLSLLSFDRPAPTEDDCLEFERFTLMSEDAAFEQYDDFFRCKEKFVPDIENYLQAVHGVELTGAEAVKVFRKDLYRFYETVLFDGTCPNTIFCNAQISSWFVEDYSYDVTVDDYVSVTLRKSSGSSGWGYAEAGYYQYPLCVVAGFTDDDYYAQFTTLLATASAQWNTVSATLAANVQIYF